MESDWPRRNKSHYVTEIVSWLGFADVIFGGDKRQPEIRRVRRLVVSKLRCCYDSVLLERFLKLGDKNEVPITFFFS